MATPDRLQFLYAAIEDKQETIRAVDFKAEILLIAMTVPLMNTSGISSTIIALSNRGSPIAAIAHILTLALVVGWFFAFVFILATIFAVNNPAAAISDSSGARGTFFSGWLFPLRWHHLLPRCSFVTDKSVDSHLAGIPVSEEEIARELAFEHMKLAYICARKVAYFNNSILATGIGLVAGSFVFLLHLLR
jgi:hypothetical protein